MSDITLTVAFSLAALAMSLVISGRVSIQTTRAFSYSATAVLVAHGFRVTISAPITERLADSFSIVSLAWLTAATAAVCARGFYRVVAEKRETLNVR